MPCHNAGSHGRSRLGRHAVPERRVPWPIQARADGGHLRVATADVATADVARITRLNRELDEAPDLRPLELDRPATPWNR